MPREGKTVSGECKCGGFRIRHLGHLSPALYGHVNLYGKYRFEIEGRAPGLRPLRSPGRRLACDFAPLLSEPHSLRHSIATHLLDAGADVAFVRDWLGHSNIQNTMVYAQLTTTTRDQAACAIFTNPKVI